MEIPVPVLYFSGQKLTIDKPVKGKLENDIRENPKEK